MCEIKPSLYLKERNIDSLENLSYNLWFYDWEQDNVGSNRSRRDMTRNDMEQLIKLAEMISKPGIKICEIGTCMGSSCAVWGSFAKVLKGKVYTIDIYNGNSWCKEIFLRNMKNLGLSSYIELLHMSSQEAIEILKNDQFDLIFLDGDHGYNGIKKDLDSWYPLVKTGGIFCGHDCEVKCYPGGFLNLKDIPMWDTRDITGIHQGVVIALSDKFKSKFEILGDRIWWIRKPRENM